MAGWMVGPHTFSPYQIWPSAGIFTINLYYIYYKCGLAHILYIRFLLNQCVQMMLTWMFQKQPLTDESMILIFIVIISTWKIQTQ